MPRLKCGSGSSAQGLRREPRGERRRDGGPGARRHGREVDLAQAEPGLDAHEADRIAHRLEQCGARPPVGGRSVAERLHRPGPHHGIAVLGRPHERVDHAGRRRVIAQEPRRTRPPDRIDVAAEHGEEPRHRRRVALPRRVEGARLRPLREQRRAWSPPPPHPRRRPRRVPRAG
jgi:hypothetical protein